MNKDYQLKDFLTENDQFELSKIFMMKLGFDFSRGRIDKSLHPFVEEYRWYKNYNQV